MRHTLFKRSANAAVNFSGMCFVEASQYVRKRGDQLAHGLLRLRTHRSDVALPHGQHGAEQRLRFRDMLAGRAGHERLTDHELEIFKRIAAGRSLVHIAAELHLSPSTVTAYRGRILEKMELHTKAEITRYAVDRQLLM